MPPLPVVRCDLHVHPCHSGPATVPLVGRLAHECYSAPEEVYEAARRRGMDLVTLTDHDSIVGALSLAVRPDTFVSEEVTVYVEGRQLHLGGFDITEHQHLHIQARRRDPEALFAYLAEQRLPACVNHPSSDEGELGGPYPPRLKRRGRRPGERRPPGRRGEACL